MRNRWTGGVDNKSEATGLKTGHYRRSGRNGPPLQGAEELEESLFFGGLELFEFFGDVGGFAAVA